MQYDYQEVITRGAAFGKTGSDYHAVIGDANVRAIIPCTNPPVGAVATFVLPANLQAPGDDQIVQIGYGRCDAAPPYTACGDGEHPVPDDGQLHFIYICHDNSGGNICNADEWFGSSPQVGQRFRFRLETVGSTWKYTLTNKVSGETHWTTIPATWTLGDGAWWGGEAYDFNSELGPAASDTVEVNMYWMQYLRNATGSNWQVAHPIAREVCELSLATGYCTGAWPSHFAGQVYNQNYSDGDAFRFWTNLH